MKIRLDSRLSAVADMVRSGSVVADIGADHGYLVCRLVAEGRCAEGYACDVNEGPLSQSRKTAAAQGLADRVHILRTDGLEGLPLARIDDIVIAGMGGELIRDILAARPGAWDPDKHLILQPMTRAEELRRYLKISGFSILRERAVRGGRFVYTILSAAYTGCAQPADSFYAWTGELWAHLDPPARLYLRTVAKRLNRRAEGMARSPANAQAAEEALDVARRIWKGLGEER